MKIMFMGTPQFGATVLESLISKHEVVMVVTQPDKPVGRKHIIQYNPVKQLALAHQLPFMQPQKIGDAVEKLLQIQADILITAAYGQFIPSILLKKPPYGAINVHGSLLPKYRGGAPIQRALMAGDTETGITIMYMAKQMDAGDILMQQRIPIDATDTADSLFIKLAALGAKMILNALQELQMNRLKPIPQDPSLVTYAYNLTKADEKIDFKHSANMIHHQIRGLSSNPGAYFEIEGVKYKVYHSKLTSLEHHEAEGCILDVEKDAIYLACGEGSVIAFEEIKPEGKNRMTIQAFLNGKGKTILIKGRKII